ncbi:PREDICTED: cystine lyase CORI3-like isoform X2 [Camelina sativa]|uniref:Cystine lyase CORI3-like isoform X2 n=1 Tax=Camelina sativa TaxID=90675 RepID=A0ABM0TX31_CAMSA|nr:PREDICTED: cystine lyase CORI3-like isoform X2 [Camelina sativa]
MGKEISVNWQFSGSEAAKKASAATLGSYTSRIMALCDPNVKSILPPLSEAPETSFAAKKAVVEAVLNDTGNAYAPSIGLPAAKSAVAEYLSRDLPKKLTADDVFMTVGCKQAIELVIEILHTSNANILLPKPGFPWDMVHAIYNKFEVREYTFLREKNYEIDFDSVRALVDENTCAILIINPHNPNGNTYSEAHLKEIAIAVKNFLSIDDKPPTVIQAAIPTILGETHKEFFEMRQIFLKANAEFSFAKLKDIPALTCYLKTEACTFLWTELNLSLFADIEDDEEFCEKLATEECLVLLPGIAFGLKNWARHSIDMDIFALEDAFARLKSFCERHSTVIEASSVKAVNGVK